MNTKHTQLLSIQNSAEEIHKEKSNSNYERKQIENTPFWLIGTHEKGFDLIMGKWKLTQEPIAEENLLIWMRKNRWNIILSMIICATTDIINQQFQDYDKVKNLSLTRATEELNK